MQALIIKILSAVIIFSLLGFFFPTKKNDLQPDFTAKKVNPDSLVSNKIFVHLDRSEYVAEDHILFKVYLIDAYSFLPKVQPTAIYIDLINSERKIVSSRIVKSENGFADGDIQVPFDSIEGEYVFRAYTADMFNSEIAFLFEKKLYIKPLYSVGSKTEDKESITSKSDIDLHFFPEGGSLVCGFINKVAIKVVDKKGSGIKLDGVIIDENDEIILKFNTSNFGLGFFQFSPEIGKQYRAKTSFGEIQSAYYLPVAEEFGTTIKLIEYEDHFRVNIFSSLSGGLNDFHFTIKQRTELIYGGKITSDKSKAIVKIPKSELLSGIFQFVLYNKNNVPICERLAVNSVLDDKEHFSINTSQEVYEKGDLITVNLASSKEHIGTINASLSVSKIDSEERRNIHPNIETFLMFNSELSNQIQNPNYFFHSYDKSKREICDLLMMTQNYRKILSWPINQNYANNFGNGLTIMGRVKSKQDKSLVTDISMVYKNKAEVGYDETRTDAKGYFNFKELFFDNITSVLIKTKSPRDDLSIEIDSVVTFLRVVPQLDPFKGIFDTQVSNQHIIEKIIKDNETETPTFSNNRVVELKEVEIKGRKKKKEDRYSKKRILYSNPTNSVDFDDIPKNYGINVLDALVGRVPGLTVSNGVVNLRSPSSLTSSGGGVLFLLNSSPVYDVEAILAIPFADVDFVDVLKGPKAAIYGPSAANGVIAVYTKDGFTRPNTSKSKSVSSIRFNHPGFYKSSKSYNAKNSAETNSNDLEGDRDSENPTLFWEPFVILSQAKSSITFNASDTTGLYKVVIQGLSNNGIPIYDSKIIQIE